MDDIRHFGVQGMHWGVHKSVALLDLRPQVKSFIDQHKAKSTKQMSEDMNKPALGEKIAKAYSLEIKNGKVKSIGLDTIPKIMATAFVAHLAISSVADLSRLGKASLKSGKIPRWVGDIAWTTGKVISNTPLK